MFELRQTKLDITPATDPVISLLFEGPKSPGDRIEFDFGALDHFGASGAAGGKEIPLFPPDFAWRNRATNATRVPLPLCEFLAYKAALAYCSKADIERELAACPHVTDLRFFDSSVADATDTEWKSGLGDTQGFGFVYQNRIFIVMRGTESDADWDGNLDDTLMSALLAQDRAARRLKKRHASALPLFAAPNAEPDADCHLGFTVAWRAVRRQIEKWIREIQLGYAPPTSFVFSGHSLGGALAFIGAYEFAKQGRDVTAVVTFGAPPVGNRNFANRYNQLMGDKTIRIEAHGDAVPDVMGRFYYPIIFRVRQAVRFAAFKIQNPGYQHVGQSLEFYGQPHASRSAFDASIRAAERELQRQAEEAKKAEAAEQPAGAKKADAAKPTVPGTPGNAPAGPTSSAATSANTAAGPGTPATGGGAQGGQVVVFVIGGVVLAFVGLFAWLFVRSKLDSHAILPRYALYLSTLSYQRLRALYPGQIELANAALAEHLKTMHREMVVDPKRTPQPFYAAISGAPVTLTMADAANLEKFLKYREGINIC